MHSYVRFLANVFIYKIPSKCIHVYTPSECITSECIHVFQIFRSLSSILGHTAVFDSLQDHKENGEINTQR